MKTLWLVSVVLSVAVVFSQRQSRPSRTTSTLRPRRATTTEAASDQYDEYNADYGEEGNQMGYNCTNMGEECTAGTNTCCFYPAMTCQGPQRSTTTTTTTRSPPAQPPPTRPPPPPPPTTTSQNVQPTTTPGNTSPPRTPPQTEAPSTTTTAPNGVHTCRNNTNLPDGIVRLLMGDQIGNIGNIYQNFIIRSNP